MRSLDLAVIGLYALAMLAIGRYYKRRVKTADDYLLGGRTMSPLMIGLSLFATLTSTLSYLAYPGEMIKNGPMMFAMTMGFPVAYLIVGWVLIPRYMQQHDVTSGYELLEKRLGLPGRMLGATMFMMLRIVWMAAILYATTNEVLVPLLGLEASWSPYISAAMGVITLIYSSEGGMRAVVLTDAMQSLIMCAGAVVVVVVVTANLGSVAAWWPTTWAAHWQEPVFWFQADLRVTFMGAFLNMVVWMTCTCGADQMAIQRYLSTRDAKAARHSIAIHLVTEVLMASLLAIVGLAVLGYFTAHPEKLASDEALVTQAFKLLPRFVATALPVGLAGLVIAAMLSAAMSSLSSGMNSASAVITSDFIARFRADKWTPQEEIRVARWASIGIGVLAVLLSLYIGRLTEDLLELCIKVVNLLTSPLFVLFFLALFVRWSTPLGGIAATIASVTVAVGIAFFKWGGLEFLWTAPVSLLAGVVVG
ncbi:MAG: sodium/solute symporter, partial [Planctomycetota bacterium]|nr:sodium/solute symporter [Planctomycetota bacterium]